MKTHFLIIIVCLTMTTKYAEAQSWELLNPKPTANTISSLDFINDSTGFFVTYGGEIYKTNDWANSFELNYNDPESQYSDISFLNSEIGFVVGYKNVYNLISRTQDGGLSWEETMGPGGFSYTDIEFSDDIHGWICGRYKTIIRTNDGGDTWQLLSGNYSNNNHFLCCKFVNQDTGFFAGNYGSSNDSAIMMKTNDGGLTLSPINLPQQSQTISDIYTFSDKNIWLCEKNQIGSKGWLYHTLDGGITWDLIELGNSVIPVNIMFTDSLNSIVFGATGTVITNDGWISFAENLYSSDQFYFIHHGILENSGNAYICGQFGQIASSTDGGITWAEKSTGYRAMLTDIEFWDENNGCVTGNFDHRDFIAYTNDGGITWQESEFEHLENQWILDFSYVTANELWAVGNSIAAYHSLDGGRNWEQKLISSETSDFIYSIEKLPDGRIMAGGLYLFISNDVGTTWQKSEFRCDSNYYIKDHCCPVKIKS